jgi:N6-L-threonylcarbamoyladenine synthase
MTIIGETTDDAVGEAFIKCKNLGLPYPGGPLVDNYAKLQNPKAFKFTKPKVPGLNLVFQGSLLYYYIRSKIRKLQLL